MNRQKLSNKKGEHEALLYKLEVKINSDGNILFNYDWVKPEHILNNLSIYFNVGIEYVNKPMYHCIIAIT